MRFTSVTCFLLALIMSPSPTIADDNVAKNIDVWIGTGNSNLSRGIYHCRLNTHTGRLTDPTLAAEMAGPGFLAMHPSEKVVYAVGDLDGKPVVAAYTVDGDRLTLINSLEIGDGGAAHVAVDPTGKTLLTAQYGGGSVAAFSLNADGSLKVRTALIKHEGGSGVVANRQEASHAHWVGFSPDNRFAFVPDLGLDKVVIYKLDVENAAITPHGSGKVPAGGGPRHMKFHPSGKFIFVLNELSLSVTVFDYNAEAGTMTPKQTIPTVSKQLLAKEKFKSGSEIRVHPSGQFVFAANRGHDTITVFRVNQSTGQLSVIEVENARAVTPRNINLDPSGNWLLAAGQDSHTLASFNVDGSTGELTYNQSVVMAPSAICVLFGHE
ncbi:6-phosphogluconolactonase [Rubripirellula tenax]|uniref:6-phosphogluconolactonase n=1 Tax=Rubripirellula tenax TaxID=2528015 RepID=A0A5C6FLP8_9BACT|nr:lactonase family protein [Rubripirellula tenax]TWU60432.1 6-phosphogluconolactonase [Rubripirellula tenax]